MLRATLLVIATVLVAVACGSGGQETPDARSTDAAGSGSDTMAMEASPHDGHLDLMVAGLGLVIVAPVRSSRRRRRPDTL